MKKFLRELRKRLVFRTFVARAAPPRAYLEKYREMVYLNDLLQRLNINCVLDVGANVGQFASDLRLIGYAGHIVSFEPLASAYEELERRFAHDAKWTGFNLALGERSENMTLNLGADSTLSSVKEFRDNSNLAGKQSVIVRRLDEVLDGGNLVDGNSNVLLKMDTQGFDVEVFKGASGIISKISALLSEVSVVPIYHDMVDYKTSLQLYEDAGFRLYNISIVNHSRDLGIVELNCLMQRVSEAEH